MQQALNPGFGFSASIHKGIPLGSGLGGSAASAVAAVVAANALLPKPLRKIELLKFAMQGEAVSSGSLHVDNISPSLFGGLVLTVGIDNPRVKQIPVPQGIRAVLVHPHLFLSTKQARGILKRDVNMSDFIWQTANLAGFISGCYTNDLDMIRASFEDVVIEKQRSQLIPGFRGGARAARWRPARWAARFPARVRPCSPGRWKPMRRRCATPWLRRSRPPASRSTTGSCRITTTGAHVVADARAMKFISTRGRTSPAVSFGAALTQGLAPDGGLYMPEHWPTLPLSAFDGASTLPEVAIGDVAAVRAKGTPLPARSPHITRDAFNFPAPLVPVTSDDRLSVLELFHGPTAAFKDFGARFLAACMQRLRAGAAAAAEHPGGDLG